MAKIVIDCRFWGPKHTGLGIYTQKLVENLAHIDDQNHYLLLIARSEENQLHLPSNFSTVVVDIGVYSLAEQFLLPWKIYGLQPDLVHFPSINIPCLYWGKYVVTIHDLIKHQSIGPETTTRSSLIYWGKFVAYLAIFKWIVFWSKSIIVPSQTVAKELETRFPSAESKITITYEAPLIDNQSPGENYSGKLPKKFAVYTGNAYPHKNLERLVRVWKEIFTQTGVSLVLIGGRSVFSQRIEKIINSQTAESYIKSLGFIPNSELASIYRRAECYVFPTLLEGFGLPGLDAMKLDLPVVCSNIPVLREIYGQAASYFDPADENDMENKITDVLTNQKLRSELIQKGRFVQEKYSWKRLAEQTQSVYQSL